MCIRDRDLIRIVALLRAPGGCPWDQAQTHASIKKNFIEETYEVKMCIRDRYDSARIEKAYSLARSAHEGQFRRSG